MATKTTTRSKKKTTLAPKKMASKKTTAKKSAPKKTVAKKTPVKTTAPKKLKSVSEKFTKTQIINHLAERTDLDKKQIKLVFDELDLLIAAHIGPRSCGEITLPIGIKVKRHEKPAQKARKGRNPFTGEEVMIKAKPKRKVVKVQAMKALKEVLEKK